MEKHIGKFADVAALSAAVEQNAISRPFVALTEDNDKVVYGPKVDLAEVGDIAVYGVAEDQIYYIKQANYNTTDFPTADYVPIGVVCRNQRQDLITFQNEEVRVMSLKWLDNNNPDIGSGSSVSIIGYYYKSNYVPSIVYPSLNDTLSDLNGKSNTESIWDITERPSDWKTADQLIGTNTRENGMPFALAWRWKTLGTSNGDWYIPASGELFDIFNNSENLQSLNTSMSMVGGSSLTFSQGDRQGVWTSSYGIQRIDNANRNSPSIMQSTQINYPHNTIGTPARAITSLTITELKL